MENCTNQELENLKKEVKEFNERLYFYKNKSYELKKELDEAKEDRDNKKAVALTLMAYILQMVRAIAKKDTKEYDKLIIELDNYIKEISKENILN